MMSIAYDYSREVFPISASKSQMLLIDAKEGTDKLKAACFEALGLN